MTESKYLELPWSVEDTIENLKTIKEALMEKAEKTNLDGKAKSDAEEIAFDFDRAIAALEENQKYRAMGTEGRLRDLVRKGMAYDQVAWERDVAIGQLKDLGLSLGEKTDKAKADMETGRRIRNIHGRAGKAGKHPRKDADVNREKVPVPGVQKNKKKKGSCT